MRPIIALILLVFATSSCHRKQVAVPLPPAPQPAAVETPEQQVPPVPPPSTTAAPPPVIPKPAPTGPSQTAPAKDESKYQRNKPPEQPPAPKRIPRPASPAPAPVPQQAPATPPADSPRLGDVLTPEQQNQFNAAIDQGLAHAESSLGSLANRQLTKDQEATVEQVKNFIQQAREKRKDDLAAAKSLAERAEVLAHDLVASLR